VKKDKVRCGAKTRTGAPCRRPAMSGKSRCRNHGGLSTGPVTLAGKMRAAMAGVAGRRARAKTRSDVEVSAT
jgi:hypothetical protein